MPISAKQENAVFLVIKQSSVSYNIVSYFGVFFKGQESILSKF